MTSRHDKAVIERLMRIPGAVLQGDEPVSGDTSKKPRPRKKITQVDTWRWIRIKENEFVDIRIPYEH